MVRFFLSTLAIAGILAIAHPVLADPGPASPCEQTQAVAPATEPSASPKAAMTPATETAQPVGAGLGKGIIAVGFGWG